MDGMEGNQVTGLNSWFNSQLDQWLDQLNMRMGKMPAEAKAFFFKSPIAMF